MYTPKKIVVFDTSGILNIAKFAIGKSKLTKDEQSTFVIYGALIVMHTVMRKFRYGTMVFAIDKHSKEVSLRKEQFPEYKLKRKIREKTPQEKELDKLAYPQFDIFVNDTLPNLGVTNIFGQERYEADDVIASICRDYPDSEIVIVSDDKDMYQLINDNVYVYHPRKKEVVNLYDFEDRYGIAPAQWKQVKSYGGCKSDETPGIPLLQSVKAIEKGTAPRCCGEGTALKFIKGELNKSTLTYKSFFTKEARRIIKRNKFLTNLPMYGSNKVDIKKDTLSAKGLYDTFAQYSFESLKPDFVSYCDVLNCK